MEHDIVYWVLVLKSYFLLVSITCLLFAGEIWLVSFIFSLLNE